MWQKFTERARRVILLAQEEAGRDRSAQVNTDYLLLGLLLEEKSLGAGVLQTLGATYETVRPRIKRPSFLTNFGKQPQPKLTPDGKRVLELAADEARRMRHTYIGTEHLMLALIRNKTGEALHVFHGLDLSLEKARAHVVSRLESQAPSPEQEADATAFGQMEAEVRALIVEVRRVAVDEGRDYHLHDLVKALLYSDSFVVSVLRRCGLDVEQAIVELSKEKQSQKESENKASEGA